MTTESTLRCPNCSHQVASEPVHCPRCGYRSELAREYLWLYFSGGALLVLGLAVGGVGVWLESAGDAHVLRPLRGWFPLGPWPAAYHWLAFLIAGILLTLAGMGLTRHRVTAWWLLVGLCGWDGFWSAREFFGAGDSTTSTWAASLFAVEAACLVVAMRLGLALRRTPPRDVRRLQSTPGDGGPPASGESGRPTGGADAR